jgi:hypothetical protein
MDVLSTHERTARKNYRCTACESWLHSGYSLVDCQSEEQRQAVESAKADGWMILKGQRYLSQVQIDGGSIYTVRARLDVNALCNDLELYPEDL